MIVCSEARLRRCLMPIRGKVTSGSAAFTSHLGSELNTNELPTIHALDSPLEQLPFSKVLAMADAQRSTKNGKHQNTDAWESQTIFSVASNDNDTRPQYLNAFANQLAEDAIGDSDASFFHEIPPRVLQTFSRLLHGESKNPFQWEISVILNKKRKCVLSYLRQSHDFPSMAKTNANDYGYAVSPQRDTRSVHIQPANGSQER